MCGAVCGTGTLVFFGMFGCGAGVCRAVMQKSSANEVSTDLCVPHDAPEDVTDPVLEKRGISDAAHGFSISIGFLTFVCFFRCK